MEQTFHYKDGLFFSRLEDNSVKIVKHEIGRRDSKIVFEMIIDDSSWASIISSMSNHGEIDNALIFHNENYEIKKI